MSVEVRDRVFGHKEKVPVDGRRFVGCTFRGSVFEYSGGAHPVFEDCDSDDVTWYFTGAALRTIQFLQMVNAMDGGSAFVGTLFTPGNYITERPERPS